MKHSSKNPSVKYRKDYQPSQYLIHKTDLTFKLDEDETIVESRLSIQRNPLDPNEQLKPLVLDGVQLELLAIEVNGETINKTDYQVEGEQLIVNAVSEAFELRTVVKIHPENNKSLEGLYKSGGKFCTQCEAEGFRKITFYIDKPEIMSEFFVRVEGDQKRYPLLLSNGNETARGKLDNERHFVEWHDPFPKPCYLFALVAGDLDCLEDQFTTMSGRNVKLALHVDKGKLDQCRFAMNSLIASMKWDEEKFGREYDLDLYMIVAVSDFNMGAMENKGLNIFNTKYVLANDKTATDDDFEGVERVIAHEYFHNWTGNRVTCRDWFQLSLKEGLTVYRDQKFSEDMQSAAVQRIDQVKIIRAAQFAEDSGPMAHPIRPDSYIEMSNFYTVTIYNKGAEVIRMMHTLLGESGFRAGMDLYFERHDGQAVTCEDFVKSMEDANNKNWKQFRHWYMQAGTPTITVELKKLEGQEFELKFTQTCLPSPGQEQKQPFMIPVKLGLLDQNGRSLNFSLENQTASQQEVVLIIDRESQVFKLKAESEAIIPSLLRDFSAPVKLNYQYSQSELATLFANDPNDFNRWDAGQSLMTNLLLSEDNEILTKQLDQVASAFKNILEDESLDCALKALAIQTPELSSLIGASNDINIDLLIKKNKQLKRTLGQSLEPTWFNLYNTLAGKNSGERWLKNIALRYMMIGNQEKHLELAINQLNHASNMTEEIAALQVIANTESGYKTEHIQKFYDKWQEEELVLDKWFSAQVLNDNEKMLEHVLDLLEHPKFSIENPNKVRAVISTFVAGNLAQFHNPTGNGYEFLGDAVIKLNSINPQIAAGLTKQFNAWRKLDKKRQSLIKEQLERIKSTPDLSADVFEIVEKSLNA